MAQSSLTDAERNAYKWAAWKDFYFFAKQVLGYKDLDWGVHGQFIKVFESSAPRKLVVMPRGSFKSTLGSVGYPLWRLVRQPELAILLDSEIYTNSKNLLREIKQHVQSEKFIEIYGNIVGTPWGESEILLTSRKVNRKEASITVGGIETTKVGQHYDLIIGDDYNSPANSDTPEKCEKVINHIKYNLNILNPGGEYVFIGTRYAERDVFGWLFKEVLSEPHLAEGKLRLAKPDELLEQSSDSLIS